MSLLWSLVIVTGLVILVYLMIAGVPRASDEAGATRGALPRTLLPMLGAAWTAGGIAGYLLFVRSGRSVGVGTAIVLGVVLAAAAGARWVVQATFAAPSTDPEDDPQYRYQGQVASVTGAISVDRPGRIFFEVDGTRFDLMARSIDGAAIATGTEVVIERIDDDVATVEPWVNVEQRL